MFSKITQSSYLNLLSGTILLITSGYEIWEGFGEASLGTQHGVAFFGLIQIFKSIPEIMLGLNELEKAQNND